MWVKDRNGNRLFEHGGCRNGICGIGYAHCGRGDSRLFNELSIDYRGIAEVCGEEHIITRKRVLEYLGRATSGDEVTAGQIRKNYKSTTDGLNYIRYSGDIYDASHYITKAFKSHTELFPWELLSCVYEMGGKSLTMRTAIGAVLLSSRALGRYQFVVQRIEIPSVRYCLRNWGRAKQKIYNNKPIELFVSLPSGEEMTIPFYLDSKKHYPAYMTDGLSSNKIVDYLKRAKHSERVIELSSEGMTELFGIDS